MLRDASPLQSSWSFIEGLVVRDGMSSEDQARRPRIPIIVLGTLLKSDTTVLLELGADDYVSRPFPGREVLARFRGASILA